MNAINTTDGPNPVVDPSASRQSHRSHFVALVQESTDDQELSNGEKASDGKQSGEDEERNHSTYSIYGVAVVGGVPAKGVHVLILTRGGALRTNDGKVPKLAAETDENGEFQFDDIPCALVTSKERRVSVGSISIVATKPWSFLSPYWRNDRRILCPTTGYSRPTSIISTYRYAIAIVGVFMIGLLAATLPVQSWALSSLSNLQVLAILHPAKFKYVAALAMTTLLSTSIILVLGLFHINVGDAFEQDDAPRVVNLGAAYLYRGSYVGEQPPQLLLSLSEPEVYDRKGAVCGPEADYYQAPCAPGEDCGDGVGSNSTDSPATGLGAPLWVILLGSIGAFAFAVQLVVKETADPPAYLDTPLIRKGDDPPDTEVWDDGVHGADLRKRCAKFVELQFHALFSPLAAIIVYQLLVAADAADEFVAVAVIILASALAVPFILRSAQRSISAFLSEPATWPGGTEALKGLTTNGTEKHAKA